MNTSTNTHASTDPSRQMRHAILPETTADEFSRQEFVKRLKFHLASKVAPGNRSVYESRALPKFRAENGREPQDHLEVRRLMDSEPYFRFWSALQRNSQEMMWKSAQIPTQRQLPQLLKTAAERSGKLGTLTLNPELPIPRYHRAVDIHCMPGGYHTEFTRDDLANGAVYDAAVHIYAMGRMGPLNSDIGDSTVAYLKKNFPTLKPQRILDLGCTVGHSTLAYVDAYPDAEVYAIDVGAPVLRYAHARAESLGKRVHFSQQNAEQTNFPDGHFDLIVSHILVHETSALAIRKIMRECHRLLNSPGIVAHAETPPYRQLPPFDAFMLDWDTRNNNEPFWGASHEIQPAAIAAETGFDPAEAFEGLQSSEFDAAESRRTRVFQGGDFGGAGVWYVWGARK
jgi:ubiquinone/menaquinone biosynthesis C-methylase UbiE